MDNSRGNSKSSWFQRLQISEQPVAYMPYQQFRISIFKSSSIDTQQNRFFYSPISWLDPATTFSSFDKVSQQARVCFRIEFWSKDVESCIISYLREIINPEIKAHNVQLIPFDQVLLGSVSETLQVVSKWIPYQLNMFMWFNILCSSVAEAEALTEEMRTRPQYCSQLQSLRIKFGLTSLENLRRKEILIRSENVRSGRLFRTINQKYPLAASVLVTAADFCTLLSQSVKAVINSNFNSNDILDATSKAAIHSTVELMLGAKKTKIESNNPTAWESVFYFDEDLRPDRAVEAINDVYNELDEEAQDRMKEIVGKRLTVSMNDRIWDAKLLKIIEFSQNTIEWSGYQFVPKSNINLFRINLSSIHNKYTSGNWNVLAQFTSASLSMAINLHESRLPGAHAISETNLQTTMKGINDNSIATVALLNYNVILSCLHRHLLGRNK